MVANQAPLSVGFPRQEHWSGLPFPPPRDIPNPEIKSASLASPALAGRFFTTSATWEALCSSVLQSSERPRAMHFPMDEFHKQDRKKPHQDTRDDTHLYNIWKHIKTELLIFRDTYKYNMGFTGSSAGKESTCNAGDLGSIPGLGRSPGGGHGNPLQYFCRENPMDRGAWWAVAHRVAELDMNERLSTSVI